MRLPGLCLQNAPTLQLPAVLPWAHSAQANLASDGWHQSRHRYCLVQETGVASCSKALGAFAEHSKLLIPEVKFGAFPLLCLGLAFLSGMGHP